MEMEMFVDEEEKRAKREDGRWKMMKLVNRLNTGAQRNLGRF